MSLLLGLLASGGVASAQETGGVINADGSNATSSPNQVSDAEGPTIVYGDIGPGTHIIDAPGGESVSGGTVFVPGVHGELSATDGNASILGAGDASAAPGRITTEGGSGMELLGPDGTYSVTETTPSNVSVGESGAPPPVYEPVYEEPVSEPAPEAAPVEPAPVEGTTSTAAGTTDAAAIDSDSDNLTDALEAEYGTDPYNIDGDEDGVADGDEINIYGTDPFTWDTDGDGISDGAELFDVRTDPLVWDDHSAPSTEAVAQQAVAEPAPE
jgi:hypothetical protein